MSKLYFTIGLARAGKDSFCSKWKRGGENRVVLSGDAFRYAVYNRRFSLVGDEIVRASLITAARALILEGYDVLINDTNTSIPSIRHILNIDKNAKAYFFTTPLETCIERAYLTNQPDIIPAIKVMSKNLEVTLKALEDGSLVICDIEEVKC